MNFLFSVSIFSNVKESRSAFKKIKDRRAPKGIAKEQRTSSYSELFNDSFNLPVFTTLNEIKFNQFPCSISLIDLTILLLRYRHSCETLIELIIPNGLTGCGKLLQYKISLYSTFYQETVRFIEVYVINLMALDICAADKASLENFFGSELIATTFSGTVDDVIFGCRHKLRDCSYSCFHFINKNSKYISDKYEPVTSEV